MSATLLHSTAQSYLTPGIRGLLEGAFRFLDGPDRIEAMGAWTRGDIRIDDTPPGRRDVRVWLGGVVLVVCRGCDTVMFAPGLGGLVGSGDRHRVTCLIGGLPVCRRAMARWRIRMRYRHAATAKAELVRRVGELGGETPDLPVGGTNRADEGLFEIWLPPERETQIRTWERCREVTRVAERVRRVL